MNTFTNPKTLEQVNMELVQRLDYTLMKRKVVFSLSGRSSRRQKSVAYSQVLMHGQVASTALRLAINSIQVIQVDDLASERTAVFKCQHLNLTNVFDDSRRRKRSRAPITPTTNKTLKDPFLETANNSPIYCRPPKSRFPLTIPSYLAVKTGHASMHRPVRMPLQQSNAPDMGDPNQSLRVNCFEPGHGRNILAPWTTSISLRPRCAASLSSPHGKTSGNSKAKHVQIRCDRPVHGK
jgi:hypothetical protein